MMMEVIQTVANAVASVIERRSVVKWYAQRKLRQRKRKAKESASMLVCGRCKQITTLGTCAQEYMEQGQSLDMSKECVALD